MFLSLFGRRRQVSNPFLILAPSLAPSTGCFNDSSQDVQNEFLDFDLNADIMMNPVGVGSGGGVGGGTGGPQSANLPELIKELGYQFTGMIYFLVYQG